MACVLPDEHGVRVRVAAARRRRALGVGGQVEAGAEPFAPTRHQDDVDIRVEVGALDERGELQRSVGDDRVALFGAVERDSRNPVGDLVGHRLQVVEVDGPDRVGHPLTIARSMIGARSSPVGRVPNAPPHWPPSRLARNASATAGCPCRTSSDPCSARQMSSATLRARYWMVSRSSSCGLQPVDVGVQPRVLAGGLGEFVEQHVDAFGPSCHGAQRVQRADVAGALPDAHQRSLPVQPRHAGLLDVAVAAEALHRLGGVRGGALAHPVLAGGQADAAQQRLALVAAHRAVGGAGHPHREHRGGLGLDREVGEHVAHQRLVDQIGAERLSVLGVVDGAGQAGAHAGRAAQCAVQPGEVDHLDDGRHAAALLADQPRGGAVVLDLADEALAWLPSLSLRRCRNIRLRVPSGSTRGRKKHDSPPGAWASTRKTSHIGAEVNHLCPVRL